MQWENKWENHGLPRETSNPERLKGFRFAEFEEPDSLFNTLSLNEESLGNRRIPVDIADQAQDKDSDNLLAKIEIRILIKHTD